MNESDIPPVEHFEVSFSLMGNEVLAFSVQSQSARKNWVFVGFLLLIGISILVNNLLPVIDYIRTVSS